MKNASFRQDQTQTWNLKCSGEIWSAGARRNRSSGTARLLRGVLLGGIRLASFALKNRNQKESTPRTAPLSYSVA